MSKEGTTTELLMYDTMMMNDTDEYARGSDNVR